MGSPGVTDAAVPALCALGCELRTLTIWHSRISPAAAARLMGATGLRPDATMQSSAGTYLLQRRGGAELLTVPEVTLD